MPKKLLKEISSIAELRCGCFDVFGKYGLYKKWAFIASRNLGGPDSSIEEALRWLEMNANETSEEGVVDEINFVLDLVDYS